jgi:hypothetical protein
MSLLALQWSGCWGSQRLHRTPDRAIDSFSVLLACAGVKLILIKTTYVPVHRL